MRPSIGMAAAGLLLGIGGVLRPRVDTLGPGLSVWLVVPGVRTAPRLRLAVAR